MLTYNIDTCDSLTNGSFGEVIGIEFDKCGTITKVVVHFYDEKCGKERRKKYHNMQTYEGKNPTIIERIEFTYTLSKNTSVGVKNASVMQFPLKLAFAATSHKVQGQTVKKPNNLVIDLRTVRESAQAYVMLSRVQSLNQLIILDSLPVEKIYASEKALDELQRLMHRCLNFKDTFHMYLVSCNIRSLRAHIADISTSSYIKKADLLCLQETWLKENEVSSQLLQITGFKAYFNSAGVGKGLAIYCKTSYTVEKEVKNDNYQMSLIKSSYLNIINIYRSSSSSSASIRNFIDDLEQLIEANKPTLIVGDFNFCSNEENTHPISAKLISLKFEQKVKHPTHVLGRCLDHVYFFSPDKNSNQTEVKVQQFGQFFTDHDMLVIQIPHNSGT